MMDKWKQNVRDEVYLIGERLHNHGERRLAKWTSSVGTQTEPALLGVEGRHRGEGAGGVQV